MSLRPGLSRLFAQALANHDEAPLRSPAIQLEAKLAHGEILVQSRHCSTRWAGSFDPFRQAGDYNVGQLALFQKAQQLVLEEAGISS